MLNYLAKISPSSSKTTSQEIINGITKIRERTGLLLESVHYSPEALSLIHTYGGKSASLIWQYFKGNKRYLLPFSVLKVSNGNAIGYKNRDDIQEFFRASAFGDENGLVGMLESIKSKPEGDRRKIIKDIIAQGKSGKIKAYAKKFDENTQYKGIDSIVVSPYIDHWNRDYHFGSIIKHPNFEDIYLINVDGGRSQCLVDSRGTVKKIIGFVAGIESIKTKLPEIVTMKIETDRAGFIQGKTTQTEFSILTEKQQKQLSLISGYDFDSELCSSIVFLQQREFRMESKDKYSTEEFHNGFYCYNMFGDQSVFRKGYQRIDFLNARSALSRLRDGQKIILVIEDRTYLKVRDLEENYGVLKDSRIAGIFINPGQSQGLGSIEHDTFRLLNNNLPIKVGYI